MSKELVAIRIDDAETSTTAAPTAATDGTPIHPPLGARRENLHLIAEKGAASGTRTLRLKVHGYVAQKYTQDALGRLTAVASSGVWALIFDTGDLSESGNFNRAWLLEGATDYSRLAIEVATNGGTTPTVTTALGFSRENKRP